jgi:hypothetical protein
LRTISLNIKIHIIIFRQEIEDEPGSGESAMEMECPNVFFNLPSNIVGIYSFMVTHYLVENKTTCVSPSRWLYSSDVFLSTLLETVSDSDNFHKILYGV